VLVTTTLKPENELVSRCCKHCEGDIPLLYPYSDYCSNACRSKKHYHDNPNPKKLYMEKRRGRRREWLNKYKKAKGCEWCGYKMYSEALHFDHKDQTQKHREVSSMYGCKLKAIIEEVRKCRVLCANCHAHHSKNQQNGVIYDPVTTCE